MLSQKPTRALKITVAVIWAVVFIFVYVWLQDHDIQLRYLPRFLRSVVLSYESMGPVVLLCLFFLRTFVFFIPSTVLTVVSGSLYGPFLGTLMNIIGENLSAAFSFVLARYFGRHVVQTHETRLMRKYDALLRDEGFYAVLMMRLLFFPFDPVNYMSGLTGITYRQYALATFFGTLPAIITFTTLGDAFTNPRVLIVFIILLVLTLLSVFALRRSAWVKNKLLKEKDPEM